MPDERHKPKLTAHADPAAPSRRLLKKLPSLSEAFKPTWFLPTGHLQTIMTHSLNIAPRRVVHYHRQLLQLSDGGTVSLDWASHTSHEHAKDLAAILAEDTTPTISYIQLTAKCCLCAGFRVVVMNARGCAKTPVTTSKLVCPAFTADVKEVVAHLRENYVPAPTLLVGIGYSLGANILLKYVGEMGTACPLSAAISLANPYDLETTTAHLATSWWHRQIYNKALTSGLVKLIFKKARFLIHIRKSNRLSNAHNVLTSDTRVNLKLLAKARVLNDFDVHYSCPIFGFATPRDIYKEASSSKCMQFIAVHCNSHIASIAIPTLCLSALDDPICPHTAIPYAECAANPNVLLAVTKHGGHLGYYTRSSLDTWYIKAIVQFAKAVKPTSPDDIEIVLTPKVKV
ncbi:serine protease family S33 [Achlya hypogyna]|uniref:Serine protease family S33 n=1 Tax=Achlya hypogyna TaxID=1202772 RepID=A0A1V9ZF95_ACHHY|nr:serine protease family S33 [Achlya hypogyna]